MPKDTNRWLVVGIGNPDRGDDAAGRAVARRLRDTVPPQVEVREHDGEPTSLLTLLADAWAAYLIDACHSGLPAGTLHRFDVGAGPLPDCGFSASTHGLGLASAIELARSLGQLPKRCIVYALEAGDFQVGAVLSPGLREAIRKTANCVAAEINDVISGEGPNG